MRISFAGIFLLLAFVSGDSLNLHYEGSICYLPPERGFCRAQFIRYYFDKNKGSCRNFFYGGCRGNPNNFRSKEECERVCRKEQFNQFLKHQYYISFR